MNAAFASNPMARLPDEREMIAAARRLIKEHKIVDAAKALAAIVARFPKNLEALGQLGNVLFHLKQYQPAVPFLESALQLSPRTPKMNMLLGAALLKLGRGEEALASCQREIKFYPGDADAHYNIGIVLQSLHRPADAVAAFSRAIQLRPNYIDALVSKGMALRQAHDDSAAREIFEEVIRRDSSNAVAHFELATILLSVGEFERGWREYEWRRKLLPQIDKFSQPLWDGKDLGGKRIFLQCEQGFGDTVQFARFANVIADLHGHVMVSCPETLRPLVETIRGVKQVVTSRADLPHFDAWAPMASLPFILGANEKTVTTEMPYLRVPTRAVNVRWTANFEGLKVGLVWAAEVQSPNSRIRSSRLEFFKPLFDLPGIQWNSLQVGTVTREIDELDLRGKIADLGGRFKNFADTAQAIDELDLVISVDTCVVHVAGALAKPVWVLVPFEPDWRWMVDREDSPWYPTARLIRQTSSADWVGVVKRLDAELRLLAEAKTPCC